MATLPTWDMRDWLCSWPALALACGLPLGKDGRPRIPCPSQQWKRGHQAGAPLPEALFVRSRLTALRRRLMGARDLIIDSAPILAWRRDDPDAAIGHAPSECIPVRSCAAIASIRCSAAAQACRSSFYSLRPSSTMLLSPDHCWNGQCTCIRSALASSAWMPHTGVFASSFGSIRSWARLPSFAFHPKRQKNRSCLPPTWMHAKNSANAAPSNAFLAASSSFFTCSALRCVAGLLSPDRSP